MECSLDPKTGQSHKIKPIKWSRYLIISIFNFLLFCILVNHNWKATSVILMTYIARVITTLFTTTVEFLLPLFIFFTLIYFLFIYFFAWVYGFFLNFTILYWFCHTSTCIHYGYTRVPHPEPHSHLLPHTIPLGHPSAPAPSFLYPASNLDWRFFSYILYMF